MPDDEPLLGYAQVAELLGVSQATLRKYRSTGRLPEPDHTVLGRPFWVRSTITRWIATRPGRGRWGRRPEPVRGEPALDTLSALRHSSDMTNTEEKKSPIEVWLSQRNMAINCTLVYEDESTDELDADSLSMRGAQREMTGRFIRLGYKPVGRWEVELSDEDGEAIETSRKFKL